MSSTVSFTKKTAVFLRDRFRCRFCGRSVLTGELSILDLTLDHLDPRATGGADDIENLLASCRVCNQIKADNVFESVEVASRFIASQKKLREKWFVENALFAAGFQEDNGDMLDLLFLVGGQEVLA